MTAPRPTLVSACLIGRSCRYDGQSKPSPAVAAWIAAQEGPVVPVCPEELGGLPTPRPAAWLAGGDGAAVLAGRARVVRGHDGGEVTAAFLAGAQAALARAPDAKAAVLKARSPSCGCGQTWIDGQVREGDGVFAALLRARGVPVTTDEDLPARR
jgi:uncharacterized protein YbbK (DUF523 family)